MTMPIQASIVSELADFLVFRPTLEDSAAYTVSPGSQRIDCLLELNHEAGRACRPSGDGKILALAHLMTLVKIGAKLTLAGKA